MTVGECRWGILGTAGIARKNWKAIRLSGNGRVVAVASRNRASAEQFINECSAQVPFDETPAALGAYEELLQREDINAVYIPLPTALRHEWVIRAAEAGKHVLGEKPAAINSQQVTEMLDACRKHSVQYMDGVMFMHSQRLPMLRKLVDDLDQLGRLRRMASQFSFSADEAFCTSNIRTDSSLEPYGCLGDLGWYCVRFFLWVMQGELPIEVRARTLTELRGSKSPRGVPGELSAELLFAGGVTASFYCTFLAENQQWVNLSGTRGNIRVHDFVLPYHAAEVDVHVHKDHFHVDNCTFNMEPHHQRWAVKEYASGMAGAQEVRMVQAFADLVLSGRTDSSWPSWTLNTQRVLDACFASAEQDGQPIQLSRG